MISERISNPRPDRLSEENQNVLELLELLSILKSSPSPKVPTALIKVVQLEQLCNMPLDEGRQGTTIILHSGERLCLPELCAAVLPRLYIWIWEKKRTQAGRSERVLACWQVKPMRGSLLRKWVLNFSWRLLYDSMCCKHLVGKYQ